MELYFRWLKITTKDFNKSLDKYISGIRKSKERSPKNILSVISKIKFKNLQVPKDLTNYEVHVEEKKPGFFRRLFFGLTAKEKAELAEEIKEEPEGVKEELEEIKEEYDELDYAEEKIEERKEGLFRRFLNIIAGGSKEEDVSIEKVEEAMGKKVVASLEAEEMREDLKSVAKITLDLISELTKAKRDRFKESPEFEEYKTILEKNKIVK